MKTVLTAIALVFTLGCDGKPTHPPPADWGEVAAVDWAHALGDNSPKATCVNNPYEYGNGHFQSECSVNAFGHIYHLWCNYPDMKCSEVVNRR